ncbi:MAG TPA: 4Fe-4S cluster-binding domain-containing protein [Bacteroidales bacterium]|nr:4Fe-4S cluster-binding domain-containing protein [Bacteroidales bacterium]
MNIIGIDYSLETSSIDVYVSGCKGPHCKNCHNPQSWDFSEGLELNQDIFDNISNYIKTYRSLIKNIMIFGGEPLDQKHNELYEFLNKLVYFNLPIWVFTRYNIEEVPNFVKDFVDYIKTGRYNEKLTCNDNKQYGIVLSTSNQKIWKKGVDF